MPALAAIKIRVHVRLHEVAFRIVEAKPNHLLTYRHKIIITHSFGGVLCFRSIVYENTRVRVDMRGIRFVPVIRDMNKSPITKNVSVRTPRFTVSRNDVIRECFVKMLPANDCEQIVFAVLP